jgi:1,2-diacylglycerol 3-alpha-glucosyltransferase
MRIGMLVDVYKPHISGITNYISLNKKFLEKSGHEVFVFTFGDEDYQDDEPNVIRSRGLPIVDTGYYISFRYRREARKLIYTMDLVHAHHPFLSGSLALRYCGALGIPVVFTNHTRYDLYTQAYLPRLPDIVGETMLQAYLPHFCRTCDMVVSPSNGMKDVLRKFGVDSPIEVVPNGVNLEPFMKTVTPVSRAELGLSSEDTVLIYVGRLGPEKNIPFLLRSFAGAVGAYEKMGLILVGSGPEKDNLQDRVRTMGIGDKVHFTGMVAYEELPRYLAAADAFVTASVTEVHPLSVIEAMAAGLPVLGIHSPGVSDSIQDGVTGLLSEEELAGFTAKMMRMVIEPERRQEMGRAARQASKAYDIDLTCRMMLDRYQMLVENATRKASLRARFSRWMDTIRR